MDRHPWKAPSTRLFLAAKDASTSLRELLAYTKAIPVPELEQCCLFAGVDVVRAELRAVISRRAR